MTHHVDRWRVALAVSDRPDGTVLVERSAQAAFNLADTVRGAVALPVSGGVATLDDHEYHEGVATHYRVTPVDPPAGLLLTGVSGDYASTPDAAVLDITGDLDLRGELTRPTWDGPFVRVVGKWAESTNQRSYSLAINQTGFLRLNWSVDGSATITRLSTVDLLSTVAPGGRLAIRATLDVNNGASGHTVIFYTAASLAGPWAQLGTTVVTAGTTSVFSGSALLEVGSRDGGTADLLTGTVHAVQVRSGIDGTMVANPDFTVQDHRDTSFADAAGRTWAVNGDAEINTAETGSIIASNNGLVILKSVRYPAQNIVVTVADYGDVEHDDRSAAFPIAGRALPTGVGELHGGRDHLLVLSTDVQAAQDHLDLMYRTGHVFYLQVPTVAAPRMPGNVQLPGSMYVQIGRPRKTRLSGVETIYHHTALPLREVTPPGPDVVGTTLTIAGLVELHGTITSVWAAYPSIRDLWDEIGSLDSLVPI